MRVLFLCLSLCCLLYLPFYSHAEDSDAQIQFDKGEAAFESKEIDKAFKFFMMAAKAGHIMGQHNVGEMYFFAQGVERDENKALKWYSLAGQQGDAESLFKVARIYFSRQEFSEAFKWYEKAGENGHIESQEMMGSFYVSGIVVDRDINKALEWYNKAAEQGSTRAKKLIEMLGYNNLPPLKP